MKNTPFREVHDFDDETCASVIIRALVDSAELSYDGKRLRFDDDTLDTVFRILMPNLYESVFKSLEGEKDE